MAPIVLFTYNRPLHTKKVLEMLSSNEGAENYTLYIFQDGLTKNVSNQLEVAHSEVRKVIENFEWPGEKAVISKKNNDGLAKSIITGVTEITERHGRVIVLEDDILPSSQFLNYMNGSLEFYQENKRVGHISGYMFPIRREGLPETFFYHAATCWGWGTWKDAWKHFEADSTKLVHELEERALVKKFNLEGAYDFFKMLQDSRDGKNDSWAIRWQASLRLNNLFSLHPRESYTQNIGFDGTGVHCNTSDTFLHESLNEKPFEPEHIPIQENRLVRKRMRKFYNGDSNRFERIKSKTKNILLKR